MDQIIRAGTEASVIVPQIWSESWYPTLIEKLPWNDSVGTVYQGEIQAMGNTVNITTFPQFPEAIDLAEGARADAQNITMGQSQLVINHQVVQDMIITSIAQIQGLDAQQKLMDLMFFSIMKKMQKIIIADVAPSASAPDHTIAYTTGTTLALADFLAAKELLDTQNVNDNGRVAIFDVPQYNDLFNIAGFMSRDFVPNADAISQGAIATPVLGFQVKWTSVAAGVSSFFHPEFLQMAVQSKPSPQVYDLGVDGQRAHRVNMTVLFGEKQVDSVRVAQVS